MCPWVTMMPGKGDDAIAGPIPTGGTGMPGGCRAQHDSPGCGHTCPASLFLHGQLLVTEGTVVIVKMQMNKIIVLAENF